MGLLASLCTFIKVFLVICLGFGLVDEVDLLVAGSGDVELEGGGGAGEFADADQGLAGVEEAMLGGGKALIPVERGGWGVGEASGVCSGAFSI